MQEIGQDYFVPHMLFVYEEIVEIENYEHVDCTNMDDIVIIAVIINGMQEVRVVVTSSEVVVNQILLQIDINVNLKNFTVD